MQSGSWAFRALEDGPPRSIVTIISVKAELALDGGEYCIAKAGGSMLTKLFALRLAPHGIGVLELRPGIIPHRHDRPLGRTLRARDPRAG